MQRKRPRDDREIGNKYGIQKPVFVSANERLAVRVALRVTAEWKRNCIKIFAQRAVPGGRERLAVRRIQANQIPKVDEFPETTSIVNSLDNAVRTVCGEDKRPRSVVTVYRLVVVPPLVGETLDQLEQRVLRELAANKEGDRVLIARMTLNEAHTRPFVAGVARSQVVSALRPLTELHCDPDKPFLEWL